MMDEYVTYLAPVFLLLVTWQYPHAASVSISLFEREVQGEDVDVKKYVPALADAEFRRNVFLYILLGLISVGGLVNLPCTGPCLLAAGMFMASVLMTLAIAFLAPQSLFWAGLLWKTLGARSYLLSLWASVYLLPPVDVNTRRALLALLGLYAGARLLTTRYRKPEGPGDMTFRELVFQKRYQFLWMAVMALSVLGVLLAVYVPVAVALGFLMLIIVAHQEVDMWPFMKAEEWVW